MQERYVETLPPGWGALKMLPASRSRRRRNWPRLWLAAAAVVTVIVWILQAR
jgi:hypothetical protein